MRDRRSKSEGFRFHEVGTLRWIQAVLGLVLIAGGALKLYAFAVSDREDDWTMSFLALLAEAEVLAGLWLASGSRPERAHPWAVAIFAGLWASSLYRVLAGRCSCGCFGDLAVSPWFVLIFDTIALILLIKWRPSGDDLVDRLSNPLSTIGMAFTALVVVAAGAGRPALVAVSGEAVRGGRPLAETALIFRGDSIELEIRTDDRGRFQLPPMRPGRYSMATRANRAAAESRLKPPVQGPRRDAGKPRRSRSKKAEPPQLSETAKWYADMDVVPLEVDECAADDLVVDFD